MTEADESLEEVGEEPKPAQPHTDKRSRGKRSKAAHRPPTPLAHSVPPTPQGVWRFLVHRYGSADPRSLGLFRIALGCLLFVDVALRFPEVEAHLSNTGWLSSHFALFRPMSGHLFSVYLAFGTPTEVKALLLAHLLVCLLLVAGYRTRLMQVLSLILLTSLNSRNILIENGGSVVLNLLVLWSAFLPLGRRFSVDSLAASLRARRETTSAALSDRSDPPRDNAPVVSWAVTALILQWAVIYLFNTLHKTGAPWRDGTAVYYFLQQDRLLTAFGAWFREVLPLGSMKALTYSTLVIEGSIAALLLLPFKPHVARMVAFGLVLVLHLSIDSVIQLGSFSWAMIVVFFAFVPAQAWDFLANQRARSRAPCVVHFDQGSGASLLLCRLLKRLDALGFVSYRAIDEQSPKRARKTLAVSQDGRVEGGFSALLAISDALWFGRGPLRLIGALGFRKRLERRLTRLATDPDALDDDLGLQGLPHEADASPPAAARLLWRKFRASTREASVLLLMVVCGSQLLIENAAVPRWLKLDSRPHFFQAIIEYPRIFQGWSMFAPTPPLSEGRLVIDGRTEEGRRLDPLTGQEPVFEVQPRGGERTNLIWGYFHTRIAEERFRAYWNGVRDYVLSKHKRDNAPKTAIVAFDAYFVSQEFPAPGQRRAAPERRKLFSHGNMSGVGASSPARAK